jgi:uncharacterized protein with ParB-like and HNH nuclease domain
MPGEFKQPITIHQAINNIIARRYLLPAIQRKFTWSSSQICVLFDSIMRGYPINTFMLWEVTSEKIKIKFKFYQFLEKYVERFAEDNPGFDTATHDDFHAVIDGQQRLTSLYIGLKGTYAEKLPRKWWPKSNDETILPPKKLYLCLTAPLKEEQNEDMMSYEFSFRAINEINEPSKWWYPVGDILRLPAASKTTEISAIVNTYLQNNNKLPNNYACVALERLYSAIRCDEIIHYYCEPEQDIDHVLNIFVRTNSGGTPLEFSDLLMSVAVANWQADARDNVDGVIKAIQAESEFIIDRNWVLKACLMLTDVDVRFKVDNFDRDTVIKIKENWPNIKASIISAFKVIRGFGHNDYSLRAKNAAIPVAYYIYKRKIYGEIEKEYTFKEEKQIIRKWLNMSLLKGVFGSHGDSVLSKTRKILKESLNANMAEYPLQKITDEFKGTSKDLKFDEEFINRLICTEKDDVMAFAILSLLLPWLDYSKPLHKDHLHPESAFKAINLDKHGFLNGNAVLKSFYADPENWNSIKNLSLLGALLNESKQDKSLKVWFDLENKNGPTLKKSELLLDESTTLEFENFKQFIENRTINIKNKLLSLI